MNKRKRWNPSIKQQIKWLEAEINKTSKQNKNTRSNTKW